MRAAKAEYVIAQKVDLLAFFKDVEDRFDTAGTQIAEVKNDNRTKLSLLTGLYWHFLGQICKHTGHDKEEAHNHAKRMFLIPIFARNPERHQEHKDVLKNMQIIKRERPEMFEAMAALVISGTHLVDADEDEMREYIGMVEANGISLGVRFQLSRNEQEFWGGR